MNISHRRGLAGLRRRWVQQQQRDEETKRFCAKQSCHCGKNSVFSQDDDDDDNPVQSEATSSADAQQHCNRGSVSMSARAVRSGLDKEGTERENRLGRPDIPIQCAEKSDWEVRDKNVQYQIISRRDLAGNLEGGFFHAHTDGFSILNISPRVQYKRVQGSRRAQ